jgi:protein TonB
VIQTEPEPDPAFTDPAGTPGSTPASATGEPGTTASDGALNPPVSTGIFRVVEVNPYFRGGDGELIRYLRKNIRYPDEAKRKGIAGVVNIEFTIAEDGTVTDLYINSGIGGGCDEEAIRVVSNMPRWIPGRQAGMAVPVRLNLPIRFSLK